MNIRTAPLKRYTLNFTNVTNAFTGLTTVPGAPINGRIREVSFLKTNAGAGTQAQYEVQDGTGKMVYTNGQLQNFPQGKYELDRQYSGGGSGLCLRIKVDGGTDTNIAVDIVVEGA